ncbi:MAG TPA: nuclear transport factor 2 family protein, partial [Candidatus Dormibacteraeota bacterium]|nr:nuclear transport factor 2 family protein [Candidatus Dormibacteraeota bacterium]
MAEEGDNLATVLGAWLDATRTRTLDPLEAMMDENITWHGVIPGTVCHGRAETIETMRRGVGRLPRVTRVEAIEVGDVVVMS